MPLYLTNPTDNDKIKPKRVLPKKYETIYLRTSPYLSIFIHLEHDYVSSYVLSAPSFFNAATCKDKRCLVLKAKTSGLFSDLTILTESGNAYSFFIISDTLNSGHPPDLQVQVLRNPNELENSFVTERSSRSMDKLSSASKSNFSNELFLSYQVQNLDQYLEVVDNLGQRQLEDYEDRGFLNKQFIIAFNNPGMTREQKEAIVIFDDNVWTYVRLWPNADKKNRNYNSLREPIVAEILRDKTYVNLTNYERVRNYIVIKKLISYGLFLQYSDDTEDTICLLVKDPSTNEIVLKNIQRKETKQ